MCNTNIYIWPFQFPVHQGVTTAATQPNVHPVLLVNTKVHQVKLPVPVVQEDKQHTIQGQSLVHCVMVGVVCQKSQYYKLCVPEKSIL